MLKRKFEERLNQFGSENKALLVAGARQVGKTFLIRKYGNEHYKSFVEINMIKDKRAKDFFSGIDDPSEILIGLSLFAGEKLIKGETLIFIDEVQETPDFISFVKFLVEEGSYKYILSGSLLGVELNDLRSMPIGYMDYEEMFPLDFEEFLIANNVGEEIISYLRDCFSETKPVSEQINKTLLKLFHLYLIVGGMPEAVQEYVNSKNLAQVQKIQEQIVSGYKTDIGKYDSKNKLFIKEVFDAIPAELNSKNRRFVLKTLNENKRFDSLKNSFVWLRNAGVALPVHICEEPKAPLELNKKTNLFKLFSNDVGLLASMYENDGIQLKILNGEQPINAGSIYENAVAQELLCHGFRKLYYYSNKKNGELDFVIEKSGKIIPIEVKSGKNYAVHRAMNNVLNSEEYKIEKGYVFAESNVKKQGKLVYLPVYMVMFLCREKIKSDLTYEVDLSGLHL